MCDEIEQYIAKVKIYYEPLITGGKARLEGGAKLWRQFTDAAANYRKRGSAGHAALYERGNELAVAHVLLTRPAFSNHGIAYEPQMAVDNRRIDFVLRDFDYGNLYVEVKTVRPTAEDTETNWQRYEQNRRHHTENVDLHVEKGLLGAQISRNSFSARSKFMEYARAFESRLDEATEVERGRGLLVFCGTGYEWERSRLEDFADFYRTGRHRRDDLYAAMEAQDCLPLRRNIKAFGLMKRSMVSIVEEEWIDDVRGPKPFQ